MANPPDRPIEGAARLPASGRLSRAELRHKVLTIMLSGATIEECAKALGVTKRRVSSVINRTLEAWREEDRSKIENVREMQLKRIDRMVRALWNKAIGVNADGSLSEPSLKAIGEIRKLEALRARIAGTEAPKKVEVAGELGFHLVKEETDQLEKAWVNAGGDVIDGTAEDLPVPEIEQHGDSE